MKSHRAIGVKDRLLTGIAAAWMVFGVVLAGLPLSQVFGQEQFFTQSGGRGLQNAKTNARITKVETDLGAVEAQVAKIQPFAYAQLGTCNEDGEKLRWDGRNWICESETDPTVQPWAKKALPTCGAGTMLGVANGEFSCVNMGFVSTEVDPTVQAWAKSPLPSCGIGDILAVGGDRMLMCSKDYQGVSKETDPNIFDFAHKDIVGALPNCATTESLTMMNGRLLCKTSGGLMVESDPKVQAFARTDITGATLAACASGEVLTAVDNGGNSVLQCVNASGSLSEVLALTDLRDVSITAPVSNSVLTYDGSGWVAATETDPIISSLTACGASGVLTWDGTHVSCTPDIGSSGTLHLADLTDVNVSGMDDGYLLQYDEATGKWRSNAIPTCTTGKILTSDGTNFSCVNDAGGNGDPLDLTELGDVRISSLTALAPSDKDFLRWDDSTSKWKAVHDKLTGTMTDTGWCYYDGSSGHDELVCDRGAPQECVNGQVMSWDSSGKTFTCVSATATLGLGTMSAQNADNVSITGGVINGTVIGGSNPDSATFTSVNLNTLNASTIRTTDLLATGLVRGTNLQVSSSLVQGSEHVTGNLQVDGNLMVSGSQIIDGVTFANGGIQLSGSISGGRVDTGSISATGNVSVTGNVSAFQFIGDGSLLTSVTASSADWYSVARIPAQVQQVSNSGAIVMAGVSATNVSVTTNATVGGDLRVAGNFYVSGSQTIDGVTFANGGIQLSGGVTGDYISTTNISATLADIMLMRAIDVTVAQDVTVTRDVGVGRNLFVTGAATMGSLGVGNMAANNVSVTNDLHVNGNLTVSGSQSIDGVTFANGGIQLSGSISGGRVDTENVSVTQNVSVTGNVSADKFIGDGSLLTNVTASSADWYSVARIPVQVQQVSNSGAIVMAGVSATNVSVTANTTVGGDLQVAGNSTLTGLLSAAGGVSVTGNISSGGLIAGSAAIGNATITGLQATSISGTSIQVGAAGSCATGLGGVIRYSGGALQVCDGTNWDSLVTNASTADRITSSTTNVIVNGASGSISFTVAGVTTGYFYNGQLVLDAISATGLGKFNDVSVTRNLTVGGDQAVTGSLTVGSNLVVSAQSAVGNVSSSANVSVTGNVSADKFIGDGSGLTGLSAGGLDAAGVVGSVQFKGGSNEISGTETLKWDNANGNLEVSGTVQMSGTGAETCGAGHYGIMRFVDAGAGDFRMQFCRP